MLTYKQLQERTDAPSGSAWGLHGANDEVGTLNFLSREALVAAAHAVRQGKIFNLDCALDAFSTLSRHRPALRHVIHGDQRHFTRDDHIDSFFLQCSSQIDGLRHFKHPRHGFYNGTPEGEIVANGPRLGIQHVAERGIAGRGVLLDIDAFLKKTRGQSLDLRGGEAFGPELLDAVASAQKLTFKAGDILLLRTGWMKFYFEEMTEEERGALTKKAQFPGLIQSHAMLAWLWDNQFSVCAADTPGVEVVPAAPTSPFADELGDIPNLPRSIASMMHPILIALFGLTLGELWALDELAAECARDGVYDFLVVSKPLNLVGGVGSPANALAIK